MRWISLGVITVQFVLAAYLYARFDAATAGLQFETRLAWIPDWGVYYHIGLDGMNVLLVLLTTFLGPLVVAGAFTAIHKDVKLFYAMVFLVQFAMLGTFLAQDLFLFYLFWEAMMIPMFLIIGIWGGERRIYATLKFVLYTAFGSILMLAAVIYLVYALHESTGVTSFAFADLYRAELPVHVQTLLLAAFALSFAIKVPIVPLHTWLPDAHVEAPTAGSVILAGVLLKMGTYGFLKLGFPLFPDATHLLTPAIMTLAVVSILYGACLALVQTDIKKIIAYSSISHLGYVMLGLVSLDLIGIQGAIIQMVSHGLTAAGLFLMVGMIYERCHSRDLAVYGGLAKLVPVYSVFFLILTLASIGLPTTSGFTGEFLVLLGAFGSSWRTYQQIGATYPLVLAVGAVAGVVLGALYMLWFAQRFLFGVARAPDMQLSDIGGRERAILAIIVVAIFALGLYPQEAMRKTELAALEYQKLVSTTRAPLVASAQVPGVRARSRIHCQRPDRARSRDEHERSAHRDAAGAPAAGRDRRADRAGNRDARSHARRLPALAARLARRAAAAATWLASTGYAGEPFPGQYSVTANDLIAKAVVLALAVPVLLVARDDFRGDARFHILLLSSLYGVCLLLSADSFLTLFLGLELMSLPVYVLVLLAYRRSQSAEAALKYLVLGGTASAIFLMGASLLFGSSGSLASRVLADALRAPDPMATAGTCSSSSHSCSRPPWFPSIPGRPMPTRAPASR